MKLLLKKYGWIVLLLFVAGGILSIGYNFMRDLFFNAGMAAAKVAYVHKVDAAEARIVEQNKKYFDMIGEAERKRQETKAAHEVEIAKYKNDVKYFQSETAVALKAKNATVEQWANAKTQDEIVIGLATDRIEALDKQLTKTLADWAASDIAKDAAHKAIVDDMALKFQACTDWSNKLEKKLAKPKFLGRLAQAGVIVAAFVLGRMTKG
jgi:hypothetical protein